MADTPDDGGPAFPDRDPVSSRHRPGMTLRQWYAGQVISPKLVEAYGQTPDLLAAYAFKHADAMIAEGKEPKLDPIKIALAALIRAVERDPPVQAELEVVLKAANRVAKEAGVEV